MDKSDFYISWLEDFSIVGTIDWTKPFIHDLLFTGNIEEDDEAYFYSIVAFSKKEWWPFYIGMVFDQTVSERHKQKDHKERLMRLIENYPSLNFTISLGTPALERGRLDRPTVEAIEGILIYGNWHEKMVNEKKISKFTSNKQIYINNTGFIEHLEEELVYGVVYRNS